MATVLELAATVDGPAVLATVLDARGSVPQVRGAMLLVAGVLQYRARFAPCPADPRLAAACTRTRRISVGVYLLSLAIYAVGLVFAFLLPLLA